MAEILVVDDSDALRSQLKEILESDSHKVTEAENGYRGLEELKKNKNIQLVLSDVTMPEMDGMTMCARIREDPELKNVQIMMLTSVASDKFKAQGRTLGIVCWVTKPCNGPALLNIIRKVLNKP